MCIHYLSGLYGRLRENPTAFYTALAYTNVIISGYVIYNSDKVDNYVEAAAWSSGFASIYLIRTCALNELRKNFVLGIITTVGALRGRTHLLEYDTHQQSQSMIYCIAWGVFAVCAGILGLK